MSGFVVTFAFLNILVVLLNIYNKVFKHLLMHLLYVYVDLCIL